MAIKTANVIARVEPEVKAQAESILNELGIPASTVINMLYRQIIIQRGIPFSLTLSTPFMLDEMSEEDFDKAMERGYKEIKSGRGILAEEAFAKLEEKIAK